MYIWNTQNTTASERANERWRDTFTFTRCDSCGIGWLSFCEKRFSSYSVSLRAEWVFWWACEPTIVWLSYICERVSMVKLFRAKMSKFRTIFYSLLHLFSSHQLPLLFVSKVSMALSIQSIQRHPKHCLAQPRLLLSHYTFFLWMSIQCNMLSRRQDIYAKSLKNLANSIFVPRNGVCVCIITGQPGDSQWGNSFIVIACVVLLFCTLDPNIQKFSGKELYESHSKGDVGHDKQIQLEWWWQKQSQSRSIEYGFIVYWHIEILEARRRLFPHPNCFPSSHNTE